MTKQTLPFSPLTHEELNVRAADAIIRAGHYAGAVIRSGGHFTDGHVKALAEDVAAFDQWQAAAVARIDGLGR